MNVQLRPELRHFLEEKVKAGEYASVEEVLEAGIARLMLDPQPQLDLDTLAALEQGEQEGDRGEVRAWPDLKAQLLAKYLSK